ncbi:MAG: DUF4386 domain-containing protein [Chloroflexi bacterium]|nr:DUF4386 domain-containing protein [Chloroflexota bacterium]
MKANRYVIGTLLVITPLLFMGAFTLLQINFEYPDILRQPASYVLEHFAAGGRGLVANWYAMLFSALLFIPIAVLLQPYLNYEGAWYLPLATVFGVMAGAVQMLGFLRWPFLVPALAAAYRDPAASEAARAATLVTFQAFNQYAGVGVGEHLGYLFTTLWSVLAGWAMGASGRFPRWLGMAGILAAVGIGFGLLEPAGVAWAGLVNAMAYVLWALWMLVVGLFLLRSKAAAA